MYVKKLELSVKNLNEKLDNLKIQFQKLKDENSVSEETATKIAKVIYWNSLLKDEEAGLSLNYENPELGNTLTELK